MYSLCSRKLLSFRFLVFSYYYFLLAAILLHDGRHTRADKSYVTKGERPSGGGVWTRCTEKKLIDNCNLQRFLIAKIFFGGMLLRHTRIVQPRIDIPQSS
jgi:hypothetical protein